MIDPVGTAPGVVVPGKPTVVVLPGPAARAPADVAHGGGERAGAGGDRRPHRVPPGDGAHVRPAGVGPRGHAPRRRGGHRRPTTSSRSPPACGAARSRWSRASSRARRRSTRSSSRCVRERHGREIFSEDGSSIDDQVVQLLAGRRVATAESCTAGLLAARLTERPGSSAYVMGGVVAYSNEAKVELLGVDPGADRGATGRCPSRWPTRWPTARCAASTPTPRWRSRGSRDPGGGTEEKPVGTVCWSVRTSGRPRHHANASACPATGPTSATARRRWRCTCCGACCPRPQLPAATAAGTKNNVSGPRARMFLALDLPDDAREELVRWRDAILSSRSDVRPVRPEALHVTLVFLGWQDESAADRIAEAAFGAAARRAAAAADAPRESSRPAPERAPVRARPGRRGRPRRPRCRPPCRTRSRRAGGTGPEKRPFWPHITLARVKRGERRVPPPPTEPPPPAEPFDASVAYAVPLDPAAAGRAVRAACAYGCGRCARSRFRTRR